MFKFFSSRYTRKSATLERLNSAGNRSLTDARMIRTTLLGLMMRDVIHGVISVNILSSCLCGVSNFDGGRELGCIENNIETVQRETYEVDSYRNKT
jgi:hypothetical protein